MNIKTRFFISSILIINILITLILLKSISFSHASTKINSLTSETMNDEILEDFDKEVDCEFYNCNITRTLELGEKKQGFASNALNYSFTQSYGAWAEFFFRYLDDPKNFFKLNRLSIWVYGSGHSFILYCYLRTGTWTTSQEFQQKAAVRWDMVINHEGWKQFSIYKQSFELQRDESIEDSFDYFKVSVICIGIGDPLYPPCHGIMFFDDFQAKFTDIESSEYISPSFDFIIFINVSLILVLQRKISGAKNIERILINQ